MSNAEEVGGEAVKLWRWREPLSPLESMTESAATIVLWFHIVEDAVCGRPGIAALWLALWVFGVVLGPRAVRAWLRWRYMKRKASLRAAESEE